MKDYTKIQIKNLIVYTQIGLYDWERYISQKLIIDITIFLAETAKFLTIENTVDYDTLSKKIVSFAQSNNYELLETLTEELCEYIMNDFPKIAKCQIKISKTLAIDYKTYVCIQHTKTR